LPQVRFHVGVDEACMERITHAPGIDPARAQLIPNGVELTRIAPRPRPLPEQPQKAAVFGKATALFPLLLEICIDHAWAYPVGAARSIRYSCCDIEGSRGVSDEHT
jgi:hypothetical protein